MIRFAVPVCAQEQECYYPTPPHPPERCLCLLDSKKDNKVFCACVCTGTWTLLPHPTPPHPEKGACVCWTARKMIRFAVPVCAQDQERYYPTPPHPTGNWSWRSSACVCWRARKMIRLLCLCVHRNMSVITPPHPIPRELCVYNWVTFVCASESLASFHQVQQDINPKGVVALLTSSATRYKPWRCRGSSYIKCNKT